MKRSTDYRERGQRVEITAIGQQLVALWGREGLRRWPAETLHEVVLPASSKRLLTEFGLPEDWPHTGAAPLVQTELPRVDVLHPYYRVIGVSVVPGARHGVPRVCLDERYGGRVISIFQAESGRWLEAHMAGHDYDRPETWDETYINSSVECFALFLILYRNLCAQANALSQRLLDISSTEMRARYESEVLPILWEVELAMRRADPEAMGNPESHWPSGLKEFRDYTMWDLE